VYLIVVVEKPEKAQITMTDPYESVRQGYRAHFAHVPGILFMLALGRTVDESVRSLSITNTESPVNVSEGLSENFEKLLVENLGSARKTQSYLRSKARHDEERKNKV
jgi:hypothetical protein